MTATVHPIEDSTVLPPRPQSAGVARQFARELLEAHGFASDSLELVVSELVANVVAHAACPIRITLRIGDRIRLEVADADETLPSVIDPPADAEGGRGLFIVDAVAAAWGVTPIPGGKCIWAEFTHS